MIKKENTMYVGVFVRTALLFFVIVVVPWEGKRRRTVGCVGCRINPEGDSLGREEFGWWLKCFGLRCWFCSCLCVFLPFRSSRYRRPPRGRKGDCGRGEKKGGGVFF